MSLRSILIVDDNHDDRYLLKRLIKKANVTEQIYESENGREGIDFLAQYGEKSVNQPEGYPPVLIFLDINMPIMGGFEFLDEFSKLLVENENLKSTVLTMFTSSENEAEKQRALSYEMVKGYMVKMPRSSSELSDLLSLHFPDL